eukprot:Hpha_TRINITY_DN14694_c1_g1::TRINITY_DN14694_c1_g1_i1::g.48246::m.48246
MTGCQSQTDPSTVTRVLRPGRSLVKEARCAAQRHDSWFSAQPPLLPLQLHPPALLPVSPLSLPPRLPRSLLSSLPSGRDGFEKGKGDGGGRRRGDDGQGGGKLVKWWRREWYYFVCCIRTHPIPSSSPSRE